MSRFIVGTTVNTLNLAGGCLFAKTQPNSYDLVTAQGKFVEGDIQKQLLPLITKRTSLIEFPNSALTVSPELALLIPLKVGEQEIGVLCLSPKFSRQIISPYDLYFLQSLSSVAASALYRCMLVHDVSLRDNFVSTASHELRTPLTSVMGYSDLLIKRDPPEATRKQWLKNIFYNSQKIAMMIDDLLNVSRIQSGKINMKLEEVNLSLVLTERLKLLKESDDKHEFLVDIGPDLPKAIVDREKFGQVVGNLLSNAVKYSPNGGRITLTAGSDKEQHHVIVSVADQGIGIGQADRDSLFTTFHRIQRPETNSIRGSGLGLFIAKEWTEAMGGKIWFESEINKGSTFFVSVPVASKNCNLDFKE